MEISKNKEKEPLVSIIIVNFNRKKMLKNCINSVLQSDYPNLEVIVVDNNSSDGSCEMLKEEFSKVRLLEERKNIGYAAGNNLGIFHARGEFIVLLNNDTIVCNSWLTELLIKAKSHPEHFYQPKILFINSKRINSTGNKINLFGFSYPSDIGKIDFNQHKGLKKANYASGACVLASRKLIDEIGLLDESHLFAFYEDVNWGWRASLLGHSSFCVSSSIIYHKWGGTYGNQISPKKFQLIEQGRLATILKNYSLRSLIALSPFMLLIEIFLITYSSIIGLGQAKITAYSNIFKNMSFILEHRKILQKKRKIGDRKIIEEFAICINHPYIGRFTKIENKVLPILSNAAKLLLSNS